MKNKNTFFTFCLLSLCHCGTARQAQPVNDTLPEAGYKLVWQDEFEGNALDKGKWGLLVGGKRRDAYQTLSAVSLDGKGKLAIQARQVNDSIQTAIIHTQGKFETRFGYFVCRVKLPEVNGLWPAFWLQSSSNGDNGTPERNGVEIDIFEYFRHSYPTKVLHTLHWSGYGPTHKVAGPVFSELLPTPDGFHTFGLEWTPTHYATYVDGKRTNLGYDLISKVPEFLLLSMEVDKVAAGPLEAHKLPASFVVDYVRVYKKP